MKFLRKAFVRADDSGQSGLKRCRKLTIDGGEIEVPAGTTILQACELAGIEVPHFCFHERLAIAGNCRMCLVEVERSPKPIASCAMPVGDGMVVHTKSAKASKARKGVMEFLLINHPLDCPICDQGGECDLQDQAMAYGFDRGRFEENKRAVRDKDFGPLVETHMTRCIHCTRCIRFLTEIAGVEELGATGRGEDMEITHLYRARARLRAVRQHHRSVPGRRADLEALRLHRRGPGNWSRPSRSMCSMRSAATSASIRATRRCCACCRGSTRRSTRSGSPTRPATRSTGCAGAGSTAPMSAAAAARAETDWREALDTVADRLKNVPGERIAAIAGDLCDAESMFALKELMAGLGATSLDCRQDGAKLDPRCRAGYLFNTTIAGIEQADACLLIGANPRWEAPLVNARLRKRYLQGGFADRRDRAGARSELSGRDAGRRRRRRLARSPPASIPGPSSCAARRTRCWCSGRGRSPGADGAQVLATARRDRRKLRAGARRLERVQRAASRRGAGRRPRSRLCAGAGRARCRRHPRRLPVGRRSRCSICSAPTRSILADLGTAFVIYQGHHGDRGAARADVILPGAAYTEKDGDLRQHRGAGAARPARRVPARRCARGLDDPARAVRRDRPAARLSTVSAELRRRLRDAHPVFGRNRPGDAGGLGRVRRGRGRSTRRRSPIRSRISTAPTRSAGPAPRWPNAATSFWRITASCRRGPARMASFLARLCLADGHHRRRGAGGRRAAADRGRLSDLCRAQGAGVFAAAQRAERRRPVRVAAALRRRAQAADQGDDRPERRQPRRLHRRAGRDLHA